MKAAVLYETGRPLIVEDGIKVPPLKPEQVFVQIAYSGLCKSQLMEARGFRGKDMYLPHMLGHEGSGIVVDRGAKVTKVKPGDYVILGWIKGKGEDTAGCTQYRLGDRIINAGGITTFSDFTIVSENRCVKLPDRIPLDIAVLFGCAIPTGAGIVMNEIQPEKGSTIAFFGLGGVGISALVATGLFECDKVIAVDIEKEKLELAKEFGATHTIDSLTENPVERIEEITDGKGVDYSIEAAGITETIEQAFQSVRKKGGRCIFASHPKSGDTIKIDPFDLICGKQIAGSWGGSSLPDIDIPKFAQLYREGKLPLNKLLNRRYPLEKINQALDDLENRKIIRGLIEISPGL